VAVHPDANLLRVLSGVEGDLEGARHLGRLVGGRVDPTLPFPGAVDQDELRSVQADADHDRFDPFSLIGPAARFFVHVHTIVCDVVHPWWPAGRSLSPAPERPRMQTPAREAEM